MFSAFYLFAEKILVYLSSTMSGTETNKYFGLDRPRKFFDCTRNKEESSTKNQKTVCIFGTSNTPKKKIKYHFIGTCDCNVCRTAGIKYLQIKGNMNPTTRVSIRPYIYYNLETKSPYGIWLTKIFCSFCQTSFYGVKDTPEIRDIHKIAKDKTICHHPHCVDVSVTTT